MPVDGPYYWIDTTHKERAKKLAANRRAKWEAMRAAMIAKRTHAREVTDA